MELHQAQKTIISSKKRFRVAICGRRLGKTTLSAWEMFAFALYNPNSKTVYIAPTIKQAHDIAWGMLKNVTRQSWAEAPNETRMELRVKCQNGETSDIWLRGSENIESLRGLGINFLVVDEVASIKDWGNVWREVLRPTLADTKGQVLFIGTPKGYNHLYELYNQANYDSDFESFRFTTYDNPYIDPKEIDKTRLEAEQTGTLDQFNQEYMAQFTTVSGQVYKEWAYETNFRPVPYEPNLPLHATFDFGVNDPTSITWIQKLSGEFRAIDYYEASNASIEHFVSVIRAKPYKDVELYTGDPAGKARSIVTNTSPIEEYAKHGIYIRTKDGVTIPEQIRISHKYMKSLFVDTDKCQRLRDCILNYRYPEKSTTVLNQSNEIPVHDEYSHAMRAMEYYFVNIDGGLLEDLELPPDDTQLFKGGFY